MKAGLASSMTDLFLLIAVCMLYLASMLAQMSYQEVVTKISTAKTDLESDRGAPTKSEMVKSVS